MGKRVANKKGERQGARCTRTNRRRWAKISRRKELRQKQIELMVESATAKADRQIAEAKGKGPSKPKGFREKVRRFFNRGRR